MPTERTLKSLNHRQMVLAGVRGAILRASSVSVLMGSAGSTRWVARSAARSDMSTDM